MVSRRRQILHVYRTTAQIAMMLSSESIDESFWFFFVAKDSGFRKTHISIKKGKCLGKTKHTHNTTAANGAAGAHRICVFIFRKYL